VITLQLNITATDGRGKFAEAFVDIIILRNPDDLKPYFTNVDLQTGRYEATIEYTHTMNSVVTIRPKAQDDDLQVCVPYHTFPLGPH